MRRYSLDPEKKFTSAYHSRLNKLQEICDDTKIVFTKIPLPFALTNNLYFVELLFHPLSLTKKTGDRTPVFAKDEIIKTLESIILFELSKKEEECQLSSEQLREVIKVFRSL